MHAARLIQDLLDWAEARGVRARRESLKPDQAGAFDGMSVTLNRRYGEEELSYYLAHALGSIVLWSLRRDAVQGVFDELRAAKQDRADARRLDRAIAAYRGFEI